MKELAKLEQKEEIKANTLFIMERNGAIKKTEIKSNEPKASYDYEQTKVCEHRISPEDYNENYNMRKEVEGLFSPNITYAGYFTKDEVEILKQNNKKIVNIEEQLKHLGHLIEKTKETKRKRKGERRK